MNERDTGRPILVLSCIMEKAHGHRPRSKTRIMEKPTSDVYRKSSG